MYFVWLILIEESARFSYNFIFLWIKKFQKALFLETFVVYLHCYVNNML